MQTNKRNPKNGNQYEIIISDHIYNTKRQTKFRFDFQNFKIYFKVFFSANIIYNKKYYLHKEYNHAASDKIVVF